MGAEQPPGGLPPAPPGKAGAPAGTERVARNDTPSPRALGRDLTEEERIAAEQLLAENPEMSHAEVREMLRRHVANLRALLDDFSHEC